MADSEELSAPTRKPDQPAGPRIKTLELKLNAGTQKRVAPGEVSSVAKRVVRLPLGWHTKLPTATTLFCIVIPTDSGGLLHLRTSNGTIDIRTDRKKVVVKPFKEAYYEVKKGKHGELWAQAQGQVGTRVECYFDQIGYAREGTRAHDEPLLPWTFFYWPFGGSSFPPKAAEIIARYAEKIRPGDGAKARAWELKEHNSSDAKSWAGHCTFAAEASMKFKPPRRSAHGFQPEELKLLAAEFCGNFEEGSMQQAWRLGTSWNVNPLLGNFKDLLEFMKPSDPRTKAQLIKRVNDVLPDDKERKKTQEANERATKRMAKQDKALGEIYKNAQRNLKVRSAKEYVEESGDFDTDRAAEKKISQDLGHAASTFYATLIDYMREKGHPLYANMRSYKVQDTAEPVWNQVYFYYCAQYQECADSKGNPAGPKDILIDCDLFSNEDKFPSEGEPAKVTRNPWWVDPYVVERLNAEAIERAKQAGTNQPAHDNLRFSMRWRLQFDDAGSLDSKHARNDWIHVHNRDGEPLFAPSELNYGTSQFAPSSKTNEYRGNVFVGQELLKKRFVTVRKRYQ
ncbi:MAG: hypothetical protein AAGG11_02505 [Pseudomonadota bacterium]